MDRYVENSLREFAANSGQNLYNRLAKQGARRVGVNRAQSYQAAEDLLGSDPAILSDALQRINQQSGADFQTADENAGIQAAQTGREYARFNYDVGLQEQARKEREASFRDAKRQRTYELIAGIGGGILTAGTSIIGAKIAAGATDAARSATGSAAEAAVGSVTDQLPPLETPTLGMPSGGYNLQPSLPQIQTSPNLSPAGMGLRSALPGYLDNRGSVGLKVPQIGEMQQPFQPPRVLESPQGLPQVRSPLQGSTPQPVRALVGLPQWGGAPQAMPQLPASPPSLGSLADTYPSTAQTLRTLDKTNEFTSDMAGMIEKYLNSIQNPAIRREAEQMINNAMIDEGNEFVDQTLARGSGGSWFLNLRPKIDQKLKDMGAL